MTSPPLLDTTLILHSTPSQLRDYYTTLCQQPPSSLPTTEKETETQITAHLLHAIHAGALPPLTFAPWLSVSPSPAPLAAALTQRFSLALRSLALKQLGRNLRSVRWRETWDALGGVEGVVSVLAGLSVGEVKEACKVIGHCANANARGRDVEGKRKVVTRLFVALCAGLGMGLGLGGEREGEGGVQTEDTRPLGAYYALLVPACEEDVVRRAFAGGGKGVWGFVRVGELLAAHPERVRERVLECLESGDGSSVDLAVLGKLISAFPSGQSRIPGFSESMEFALAVLRTLAERNPVLLQGEFFISELVRPLLRRAIKRGAECAQIQEIVDLMLRYLDVHPSVGKDITSTAGDVHHLVAQCWALQPELFGEQLKKLCSHPVYGADSLDQIRHWDDFLEGILPARRYELLRFVFLAAVGLDIDVDADLKKTKGALTHDLLKNLGSKHALSLFTRLRKARGDEDLVDTGDWSSVLSIATTENGSEGVPELYQIVLESQNGNDETAKELAARFVQARKKKASNASQAEQRGFYGKSAVFGAFGSGDMALVQETVAWSKRFIRDPLAAREVFGRWDPSEAARLLSGIPKPLEKLSSLDELRQRVDKCHAILVSMFEISYAALREPSFAAKDWNANLSLLSDTIQERIDLSGKVKAHLKVSDEELYRVLWEPTIPFIVSLQEKACEEGHERLETNLVYGILNCLGHSTNTVTLKDKSTLRFIDNLAKATDHLWASLRKEAYPAVTDLPPQFPRGLPIQYLTGPWYLDIQDLESCAPYLSSRVKAVLFPDPVAALQTLESDEETQQAVGVFVDEYKFALQMYVPRSCSKKERERRVQEVWDYAVGPLSQDRMSKEEAVRFWKEHQPLQVPEWPPRDIAKAKEVWPILPQTDDPEEACEWNPLASGRPDFPARELGEFTYIDLALNVHYATPYRPDLKSTLDASPPEVPAHEVDADQIWAKKRDMGEGGVLSALLYLDAKFASDNHLLEQPFPSKDEPRYPHIYLDGDFLANEDIKTYEAARNTRFHLSSTPPQLIEQLARNLLKALDSADPEQSTYVPLHEAAMHLIIRLGESDMPVLASELAIRVILDRPESSSWHRQLLKPGFLNRLPAADAKACFEAFSGKVLERVGGKDGQGKEEDDGDEPYVKVTTIKSVAQLLQGSKFIGEDVALSILSQLSVKTPHVDVQLNIVKGLLDVLSQSSTESIGGLLAAIGPIVRVAGTLNERESISEVEWALSEETLSLPELQEGLSNSSDTSSPILAVLVSHFKNGPSDAEQLQPFVDKIILPILESLKQQTSRWVALFLRKHGVDTEAQLEKPLPPVPRGPSISQLLLTADIERVRLLPRTVLEEHIAYLAFNIAPSAPIRDLNKKLKDDPALISQPEVQTWLRLYGRGLEAIDNFEHQDIIPLLGIPAKQEEDSAETALTPRIVQEQFLKLFTAVLWNDTPAYTTLTTHLTDNLLSGTYLTKPWWKPHGRPIVSAMISYVSQIRTRDWERDPQRRPSVLPDPFPWRLLLLDYPWPDAAHSGAADREKAAQKFAAQIASLLDDVTGSLYHGKLAALLTYLALDPVSSTSDTMVSKRLGSRTLYYEARDAAHETLLENRVLVALYLGDISKTRLSWVTAPEVLRVHVAAELIELGGAFGELDRGLRERVRVLVDSWTASESEEVRRVGWEVKGRIE
ncbi:hypothetical protein IQ07DRAFT_630441 [Pyrenochaeta sp. DS3sAY3a]|nr:hypothetical protein IQ07DRAFT_630441 [Pyrenochaeta sp. DS3sAY3a]